MNEAGDRGNKFGLDFQIDPDRHPCLEGRAAGSGGAKRGA